MTIETQYYGFLADMAYTHRDKGVRFTARRKFEVIEQRGRRQLRRQIRQTNCLRPLCCMLVLATIIGGCTRHEPVPPPKTRRNVDSTEKYTFTLTTEEPGDFDRIEARSAYTIINESDCVPMDYSKALGGLRNQAIESLVLPVTRIGEDKFHAETPKSPFLDENYYSLGICRWSIDSVEFVIHRSGYTQAVVTTREDIEHNKERSALCLLSPSQRDSLCIKKTAVDINIRDRYFPVTIVAHKE